MDELKNKLIEDCNASGLPLDAIFYIVKDLLRDITDTIQQQVEVKEEE